MVLMDAPIVAIGFGVVMLLLILYGIYKLSQKLKPSKIFEKKKGVKDVL